MRACVKALAAACGARTRAFVALLCYACVCMRASLAAAGCSIYSFYSRIFENILEHLKHLEYPGDSG
jgi:hypothetical protein